MFAFSLLGAGLNLSLFINSTGSKNNLISVLLFLSHPWVDFDPWKVYTNHLIVGRQAAWAVHLESQRWGAAAHTPHLGQNAPASPAVSAPKLPAGGSGLYLMHFKLPSHPLLLLSYLISRVNLCVCTLDLILSAFFSLLTLLPLAFILQTWPLILKVVLHAAYFFDVSISSIN